MAKKKTVKKVKRDEVRKDKIFTGKEADMTTAEQKRCIDSVKNVVSGKSKGFVYAAEIKGDMSGGRVPVNGTLYSHGTSPVEMVYNLVSSLAKTSIHQKMLMLKVMLEIEGDDE